MGFGQEATLQAKEKLVEELNKVLLKYKGDRESF